MSELRKPSVGPASPTQRRPSMDASRSRPRLEAHAGELEASGLYRVLRKVVPRPVRQEAPSGDGTRRTALILDTETTGLDPTTDEIVELGMIAVDYDGAGLHDVRAVFEGLREPSGPIPPNIETLTGLKREMLLGRRIDSDEVSTFAERADIVVAHNAEFDHAFCERQFPALARMRWACSYHDIDWKAYGAENSRLSSILATVGLFHDGHRALADCQALVEVLAADRWLGRDRTPFGQLLTAADTQRVEIVAVGQTYEWRDRLKARGYRWSSGENGKPKGWTVRLERSDADREIIWLSATVYARDGAPIVRDVRWRS